MSQPKLCGTSHVIPSRSYALAATVHPVRHDGTRITISGAPCRLAAARRPVARRFLCRRREREERSSSARASTTWDVPPLAGHQYWNAESPLAFGLGCSQIYYPIPTPVPTPAESPPTPLCEPRLRAPTGAVLSQIHSYGIFVAQQFLNGFQDAFPGRRVTGSSIARAASPF